MINPETSFEQNIVMEDEWAKIEPLEERHYDLLLPVAMHDTLWTYTVAKINTPEAFKIYFDQAMYEKRNKKSFPFAFINKQTGQYVGSSRYANIDAANKRLEIGWSWIDPSLHGTGFNRHIKWLMLSYGFDVLAMNRIELKTSHLNLRSQKAMQKIGAVKEGVLRNHTINDDGTIRHTMYFSFIREEWPETKVKFFSEFC